MLMVSGMSLLSTNLLMVRAPKRIAIFYICDKIHLPLLDSLSVSGVVSRLASGFRHVIPGRAYRSYGTGHQDKNVSSVMREYRRMIPAPPRFMICLQAYCERVSRKLVVGAVIRGRPHILLTLFFCYQTYSGYYLRLEPVRTIPFCTNVTMSLGPFLNAWGYNSIAL